MFQTIPNVVQVSEMACKKGRFAGANGQLQFGLGHLFEEHVWLPEKTFRWAWDRALAPW
jgi:hypothetical protein